MRVPTHGYHDSAIMTKNSTIPSEIQTLNAAIATFGIFVKIFYLYERSIWRYGFSCRLQFVVRSVLLLVCCSRKQILPCRAMKSFVCFGIALVAIVLIVSIDRANGQLELEMPGFLRRFWDRVRYDDKGVILGQFITP